jgi:hypothetical protein
MSLHRNGDDDASYCKQRDNMFVQPLAESSSGSREEYGAYFLVGVGPWSIRYRPIDRFDISGRRWRASEELRDDIAPRVTRAQKPRLSWGSVLRKDRLDSIQELSGR